VLVTMTPQGSSVGCGARNILASMLELVGWAF
jgi:hypothetical protein